jgi:hypothetical protein
MAYKEISAEEFAYSPFKTIGKDWLLVTAQKDGRANAMTASWGGLGVMWGKNVAFIVIRPQRYTKEFIDGAEGFSLSVFGEERRKMMSYFTQIKKIHTLKNILGLEEELYRDMLASFGVGSSKNLTETEAQILIEILEDKISLKGNTHKKYDDFKSRDNLKQ